MTLYSLQAVDDLIARYQNGGCEVYQMQEGVLGHGVVVLFGEGGLRSAVIKEVYLNEWSSGHTVRFYQELPKKYQV